MKLVDILHQPTPVDKRLCSFCTQDSIEDEFHIFECQYYKEVREKFKLSVNDKNVAIKLLKDGEPHVAAYAFYCLEKRSKTIAEE